MFWKKHKPKKAVETLDPTPLEIPVKFHRPPTLQEQMRRYTINSLNAMAQTTGHETFEDANDFEIGESYDPASPHELEFGPQEEAFERFAATEIRRTLKRKAAEQLNDKKADPAGSVLVDKKPSDAEGK